MRDGIWVIAIHDEHTEQCVFATHFCRAGRRLVFDDVPAADGATLTIDYGSEDEAKAEFRSVIAAIKAGTAGIDVTPGPGLLPSGPAGSAGQAGTC